jgi:hypothetical protein
MLEALNPRPADPDVDKELWEAVQDQVHAQQEAQANSEEYKQQMDAWRKENDLPTDTEIYDAEQDGCSPQVVLDENGNPICVPPDEDQGATPYAPYAGD